jgi:hypothetical protein
MSDLLFLFEVFLDVMNIGSGHRILRENTKYLGQVGDVPDPSGIRVRTVTACSVRRYMLMLG